MPTIYTAELDADIERLWRQRQPMLSAREIGVRLQLTKNQVLGRVHRLGLARRESPIRYAKGKRTKYRRAAKIAPVPLRSVIRLSVVHIAPPSRCQWIEGEPSADDSCKCGRPSRRGWPYCATHAARVVITLTSEQARRRDAEIAGAA